MIIKVLTNLKYSSKKLHCDRALAHKGGWGGGLLLSEYL